MADLSEQRGSIHRYQIRRHTYLGSNGQCQSDEALSLILCRTATFNQDYLSKIRGFGQQRLIIIYSILAAWCIFLRTFDRLLKHLSGTSIV